MVRGVGGAGKSSTIDHLLDHQYQPAGRRGRSPRTIFGPNLSIIDEICWPLASKRKGSGDCQQVEGSFQRRKEE